MRRPPKVKVMPQEQLVPRVQLVLLVKLVFLVQEQVLMVLLFHLLKMLLLNF